VNSRDQPGTKRVELVARHAAAPCTSASGIAIAVSFKNDIFGLRLPDDERFEKMSARVPAPKATVKLPRVKDAIAAAKASAPLHVKHLITHGVDDDGRLVELDMRRTSGNKWLVVHRPKTVSG
jgi:hypothetical protein